MSISNIYLKGLCDSAKTYFKGAAYCSENRVNITSALPHLDGSQVVIAKIRGSNRSVYQTQIQLSTDGEQLLSYRCSCPAFGSYDGACKHVVALALKATEPPPQPAGIKTDAVATRMLRQYAHKALLEVSISAAEGANVALVPTLELAAGQARVSFKIGTDRMYVLKDISLFVNAVKNGETIDYGKQFSLTHSLNAFDAESAALVRFLLTYYDSRNYMYADGYYYYGADRNRSMFLPSFILDELMSLFEGRLIAVDTGRTVTDYAVRFENPRLKLHINPLEGGGYTLRLSKPISVFRGDARTYLAAEKTIFGCDEEFSRATDGFFKAISEANGRKMTISEADMPTVAATLLPALEPYLSVISDCDLSSFLPPPLQSKVYFDMPSPELVTARLEHHYGERMHPGFQRKSIRESLDLRGESKTESVMLRYLNEMIAPGVLAIRDDEKALFELVDRGVSEITEYAEVFVSDAFKTMRIKPPASVSVGVRVESDLLRLHFDVQGMNLSELEEVLASYRKAKKYHRLRDGSFLSLENSALSEISELAQGLDLTAKEMMSGELSVSKYRALYLDSLLKESERIQYDRDGAFKQIIRDVRDVSDADFKIPKSLKPILRNYQKTGYHWMRTIAAYGFGGILADDMGLGKTLQVLSLLLAQKEEEAEHTVSIVVCPSSLVLNWESEVQKFAPTLHAVPVVGVAALREELIRAVEGVDLFITSYDSLKRDVGQYVEIPFRYVVADEAQYMKNQNTQNAKAVKTLRAGVRLALTGTPVENNLAEVWSIFDFLMPEYLYRYAKFRSSFESPIVKQGDELAAKNLRQMVSPFILRRMKKDVLKELPEKIETVLYAELESEQKKLYLANAAAAKKEMEQGLGDSGADKLQILALITRLRQICCDPALVYENYTDGSAKLELCMELLQNCMESGHRVLLFSQFTSMLSRIAARLNAAGTAYFTITGDTKVSQRLDLVNAFNEGDTPLFLISLKAGGTGLNLTGADVVIHYDPWWNNSAQNQASDRAHRIGQTKTVQVYKLIIKNSIEARILEMQKNKSDLADMIVKEGDGSFARMTKQEILALFE